MISKFSLNRISLISFKERKARVVYLDPKTTIITGKNKAGKSCLIKSIFWSMGAAPAKFDKKWFELDPICILTFTINDIEYNLVREEGSYSLYKMPDDFIWSTGKISELGNHFRELFDINLFAVDRHNNGYYCPPSLLFLPFYIDQDLGWTQPDKQFSRWGHYANNRKKSNDYWTGIRGEYYSKMEREKTILEAKLNNRFHRKGNENFFGMVVVK